MIGLYQEGAKTYILHLPSLKMVVEYPSETAVNLYVTTRPHIPQVYYAPQLLSLQTLGFVFIAYLLTPGSRVLLEKPTDFQSDRKLPAFYGTRRFITAFTSARHLSLS